jgi:XTP/dITP diphosphohydrolase
MATIVLATRNAGKIRELSAMLAEYDIEVRSLDDFPDIGEIPEEGDTFEANALQKACTVARLSGLVAVADDSGLVVDALGGAPGVNSARYAGSHGDDAANNDKLLRELEHVPDEERSARFVCVMAACAPTGAQITARGEWEGRIIREERGEGGFGYDPLFLDPTDGKTGAELPKDVKNARSHRGKALHRLLEQWPGYWAKVASASGTAVDE